MYKIALLSAALLGASLSANARDRVDAPNQNDLQILQYCDFDSATGIQAKILPLSPAQHFSTRAHGAIYPYWVSERAGGRLLSRALPSGR